MLPDEVIDYLQKAIGSPIQQWVPVSGGDIAKAFKLVTDSQNYFLKSQTSPKALAMFQAEQKGLQTIGQTQTILVPKTFLCDQIQETSFLLMEFIESKKPDSKDMELLGSQLAQLHQTTQSSFGWDTDNFIGSLPQTNTFSDSWTTFYIQSRLLPQFHLAKSKNLLMDFEIPSEKSIYSTLEPLFHEVSPSLIHGDLWSGNFLISSEGIPYLIDPAVYYGHSEVDLAMTKLFGGFDTPFYQSYFNSFPKQTRNEDKIEIYQLYYLLVHLNLFGTSYYHAVKSILKAYF